MIPVEQVGDRETDYAIGWVPSPLANSGPGAINHVTGSWTGLAKHLNTGKEQEMIQEREARNTGNSL
jgi:hypothetical protein